MKNLFRSKMHFILVSFYFGLRKINLDRVRLLKIEIPYFKRHKNLFYLGSNFFPGRTKEVCRQSEVSKAGSPVRPRRLTRVEKVGIGDDEIGKSFRDAKIRKTVHHRQVSMSSTLYKEQLFVMEVILWHVGFKVHKSKGRTLFVVYVQPSKTKLGNFMNKMRLFTFLIQPSSKQIICFDF